MKSKRMWTLLAAMALVVALGVPAQADPFTVDTLLTGIDSANSGQSYEEEQLELACGCSVTLLTNVGITDAGVQQDLAGNNFIDVDPSTPGYFLLKFGTGNTGNDMFFFQNIGELTKLVWTDAQLTGAGLPADHVQSISHYAITTDVGSPPPPPPPPPPPTSVPEPSSLTLVGCGLIGLAGLARRKMK